MELGWLRAISLPKNAAEPNGALAGPLQKDHHNYRVLNLWFSHPQFDRESLSEVRILDARGQTIPLARIAAGCRIPNERNGNLGWLLHSVRLDDPASLPEPVTVRLYYTVGPLERPLDISPDNNSDLSFDDGGYSLAGLGQNAEGNAFISIAVDSSKMQSRVVGAVAVAKDGRELHYQTWHPPNLGSPGMTTEKFEFKTPLSAVAQFRIGTRPIRTNEWTNVVLPDSTAPVAVVETKARAFEIEPNTNQEVARLKFQQAEQELETTQQKVKLGLAPSVDYERAKIARDLAAAEVNGDNAEVARLKLKICDLDLDVAGKKFAVGKATQQEYAAAKLARDEAAVRVKPFGRTVPTADDSYTLAGQPPVVVETFPVSGARGVVPGEAEIRVRFSKPMTDDSWSWSTAWENSTPESVGAPHYLDDQRTCVMKVRLEPGRTYAWWLNSDKFKNFADQAGQPAVPYLLIFQTKPN